MELQPGIPQGKSSQSSECFIIKNSLLSVLRACPPPGRRASAVRYPNSVFTIDAQTSLERTALRGFQSFKMPVPSTVEGFQSFKTF